MLSYSTGKDTVVIVNDYRPVVKSIYDVQKTLGYLIPKQAKELVEWVDKQGVVTSEFKEQKGLKIEQYFIKGVDSIDFKRDMIINPKVESTEFKGKINAADYIFIQTAQMKGNMIVLALEPKSELGLVTYKQYELLLKVGEAFPVLRVEQK